MTTAKEREYLVEKLEEDTEDALVFPFGSMTIKVCVLLLLSSIAGILWSCSLLTFNGEKVFWGPFSLNGTPHRWIINVVLACTVLCLLAALRALAIPEVIVNRNHMRRYTRHWIPAVHNYFQDVSAIMDKVKYSIGVFKALDRAMKAAGLTNSHSQSVENTATLSPDTERMGMFISALFDIDVNSAEPESLSKLRSSTKEMAAQIECFQSIDWEQFKQRLLRFQSLYSTRNELINSRRRRIWWVAEFPQLLGWISIAFLVCTLFIRR
jgi:hypothetical protein